MSERSQLDEISIRGLGIIDQSTLTFSPGLNVLTGETGAGKTMILTALHLVLGGKSDSALVRHGSERLIASAQFSVSKELEEIALETGASIDDGSLILTRSVNADGKSKAIAGGTTVPASTLASLADHLIEIHGQAANHQIVKPARQRELLDRFGGEVIESALAAYQGTYSQYLELKDRIKVMKASASKRDGEIASIEEFYTAWVALKAVRGEYTSTEEELLRLSSVEDLRVATEGALGSLDNESALADLTFARKSLDLAKGKDPALDAIGQTIAESFYLLDDAVRELHSYQSKLEADPTRLDHLQSRKAAITAFLKKWGSGAAPDEDLVSLSQRAKSAKSSIEDLRGGDERIIELEKDLLEIKSKLLKGAMGLTNARTKSSLQLSELVTNEIKALSMPHTVFSISIETPDYSSALKESDFTTLGCDEISMRIQGHVDGPWIALGKGASGGEMSRIMLALEVVLAQRAPVGTYIFDEVDAGVGGKAAIEVGRRLHQLAQHTQVIVVTHLPQVAAWADAHFMVKKSSDGTVTQSDVVRLDQGSRIEEIARMLAGLEESTSAREHAAELLALRG